MKILYISNSRIPTTKAYGRQIINMCHFFAAQSVELELILPRRTNKEFKYKSSFDYYSVAPIFTIKKIWSYDPWWLIKPLPQGIYIKFQALFFITSLFFYLLFKKNKSEYIFYTRDEYLLPLLQLFSGRVVWEGHSLPHRVKFYRPYFIRAYRLIVLTHQLKNKLTQLGLGGDKIFVASDAVDLDIFDIKLDKKEARRRLDLPQDKIILLYTGSFMTKEVDKGISHILGALKNLSRPELLFVAVGGNDRHLDYYRTRAARLHLQNQVLLLPPTSQAELAVFQKAADILLMPFPDKLHYRYYMSPLKMFEYMASHRPIITSNLPSIREVLNEKNSVLISPDRPNVLALAIEKLLLNPTLIDKITKHAHHDVQAYSWQQRAKNIINFLSQ